jgi:SAM-dependent methyltransferase
MDRLPFGNDGRAASVRRSRPRILPLMDIAAFVEAHLPPVPARVLEVGCGGGDLARTLAGLGHDVVAIDPDAPDGDIFRAVSLEEFGDPGPFDAVVAIRSLHHIHELSAAVAKLGRLLGPGGRVVVYEHAWERFDARTARWYLDQRAAHPHAHAHAHAPRTVERCLRDWPEDHRGLHTAATMRAALGSHFRQREFAWTPYLYGELGPAVTREQEQRLIDAGTIAATGFSYVGDRGP